MMSWVRWTRRKKDGKVKKTTKLGKWKTGYGGDLTPGYKAWRKKRMQMARRSRSINHAQAKH